uniref:Uncharacterized protein n=1 Tax=Acrobeloides nanus TaxID=290746 RepID=A0A914CHF5_9BILA
MIVWLTIPIVYGLTTFYQVPALYSTKLFAYFFDPFIGTVGLQGMPQMTLQSLCICVEIFIAAVVYVYMQFFPVSEFVIIVAHICWILIHGDTPIVYLLLNVSLRTEVFKMVRKFLTNAKDTTNKFARFSSIFGSPQQISPLPDT